VERYGFLGGNATAALVMPLMSFHNEVRSARDADAGAPLRLLPTDHGPGEPMVAGVLDELLERLVAAGGAVTPTQDTGYTVPIDPELYKLALLDMLDDAGVHFLFHSLASGVVDAGVVFETKSGPIVIEAGVVVDCTGDGDVAARAGAHYSTGREPDGLTQPMTLMFRMVEFDREGFGRYAEEHPGQWHGVHGLWELIAEARAAGELELPREDVLFFATPHERELSVNSTRAGGLGIDPWEITRAEWLARRQMREIVRFLRTRVPGFEASYNAQSGSTIGVRETRRIVGDYRLTGEDVLTARKFDDAIARGSYPVDIHDPEGEGTVLERLPPNEAYDIPLRCLLPQGLDRVMTAGRCISGTHEAHSSYRVTPIAMATGHAAGVCAALAARSGRIPRQVAAAEVQRELLRQGASLRPGLDVHRPP
ncbi:MAG TPA: FAD-dependent oxidoreductase, partial [Thermoleophilaceae bacterium]|nr:FAD-dependent oxidoreductase [Thermoleophilaceae bacterium]